MNDEHCYSCGNLLEKRFELAKRNDVPGIQQYIGVEVTGVGWYCNSCWLDRGHSPMFACRN